MLGVESPKKWLVKEWTIPFLALNHPFFLESCFFGPAFLMVSTGNPQNGSENLRSSQNEAAVKPPDDGWPCRKWKLKCSIMFLSGCVTMDFVTATFKKIEFRQYHQFIVGFYPFLYFFDCCYIFKTYIIYIYIYIQETHETYIPSQRTHPNFRST